MEQVESRGRGECIQTYTGGRWFYAKPRASEVDIIDIAHALSLICRFSGHVIEFYSVAEHSVRVAQILPPELKLWGLLHDASEAYCIDVPRPLKYSPGMEGYKYYEGVTMQAICKRYGLTMPEPPMVKQADTRLLITEQRDLMGHIGPWKGVAKPLENVINPWTSKVAERRFMKMFEKLYQGR